MRGYFLHLGVTRKAKAQGAGKHGSGAGEREAGWQALGQVTSPLLPFLKESDLSSS